MKRRRRSRPHANHERWLVSYADFITLMFAFFVVLFASSQSDKKKQAEVSQSINQAFRTLGLFEPAKPDPKANGMAVSEEKATVPVNIVLGEDLGASPAVKEDLNRMERELEGKLSNQIAEHIIALHIGRDGLVISLREAGFYDSGSAVPQALSMASVDSIAETLKQCPYDIRIEGHTDNVPIHTGQFDSNWELSTARATRLARLLIERHDFRPARLSASGYAEFHPVASNDTAEGRGENRRVDIIVLPRITARSPGSGLDSGPLEKAMMKKDGADAGHNSTADFALAR
ncbi:MAG TPA: flagellar motor protein MotB [Silvibacterium sp.]|nr:flagellar motor protein MotB [Silvibacterium sp.]